MSNIKVIKAAKQYPRVELVLLYSFSFEDGVILTQEAFVQFLKYADRNEVVNTDYSFITPEQARLMDLPVLGLYDLPAELLRSYEAH